MQSLLSDMAKAREERDWSTLGSLLHTLIGSSGTVAALDLHRAAMQLQVILHLLQEKEEEGDSNVTDTVLELDKAMNAVRVSADELKQDFAKMVDAR